MSGIKYPAGIVSLGITLSVCALKEKKLIVKCVIAADFLDLVNEINLHKNSLPLGMTKSLRP